MTKSSCMSRHPMTSPNLKGRQHLPQTFRVPPKDRLAGARSTAGHSGQSLATSWTQAPEQASMSTNRSASSEGLGEDEGQYDEPRVLDEVTGEWVSSEEAARRQVCVQLMSPSPSSLLFSSLFLSLFSISFSLLVSLFLSLSLSLFIFLSFSLISCFVT